MRKTITTAALVLAAAALAAPAHAGGATGSGTGGDLDSVDGKATSYLCALTSAAGTRYFSCAGNPPLRL